MRYAKSMKYLPIDLFSNMSRILDKNRNCNVKSIYTALETMAFSMVTAPV